MSGAAEHTQRHHTQGHDWRRPHTEMATRSPTGSFGLGSGRPVLRQTECHSLRVRSIMRRGRHQPQVIAALLK